MGLLLNWNRSTNPCDWTTVHCDDNDSEDFVIRKLELGGSEIGGRLAGEIGKLKTLQSLLTRTNYTIFIDFSFTEADRNMSKSGITGSIPPEIGDLNELVTLDLSHNNLNDVIPWAIGKLLNLTTLLLNDNDLVGCEPVDAISNLIMNGSLDNRYFNLANNPNLHTSPINPGVCGP
ncbi:leucine-rich repeat protein kinase family protein [Striga asiatica]|uniref:Leucine-rich repeat protein kinase family protein n=1 Tax=Striga asiatica TaxID=4170 RepID=A0A5A7PGG6_STRAF|nr:leucine-rich repeat protein kinase family protein [Striga asiatica]